MLQSKDLNPGSLDPEPVYLATIPNTFSERREKASEKTGTIQNNHKELYPISLLPLETSMELHRLNY